MNRTQQNEVYSALKAEAKANGEKTFMGRPCLHGHDGRRSVTSNVCIECNKEYRNRPENKERQKSYQKKYNARLGYKQNEVKKELYKSDPIYRQSVLDYQAEYRSREGMREKQRAYHLEYRKSPEKRALLKKHRAKYNAKLKQKEIDKATEKEEALKAHRIKNNS